MESGVGVGVGRGSVRQVVASQPRHSMVIGSTSSLKH